MLSGVDLGAVMLPMWLTASSPFPLHSKGKKASALDMKNQVLSRWSNMSFYLVPQTLETTVITLFSFTKPPFCPHYILVMAHKFCEGTEVNTEVGN